MDSLQEDVNSNPEIDTYVRNVIHQYRTKLLDLTRKNPLISFRHSERSKSHIRVVDEIPEVLFGKLTTGKPLAFIPLPDPELIPEDETNPTFLSALRTAKAEDEEYKQAVSELGPTPSARQMQKLERNLRNRVRATLGLPTFQPTWDPKSRARELGMNPDYELPAQNGQTERRYNDAKIQTLLFSEALESKLGGLRDSARVLEKDAGYNALYCAFGFLEYYESEHSDVKRHAPLVFVPVALERQITNQQYLYSIQARNEDIQVNVALAELLKQMSVTLPSWSEDENIENPLARYLSRVEEAIYGKRDWKIKRYVTCGLFTFSTLAMYNDLDPERWASEDALERRPIVSALIAGTEVGNQQYAEDYEIDTLEGPEPLLITDADSSQHSAIVDVLRSKSSQVIQGPPGTGKSQTITNIISAALNEGLSVLFVAEKMAALDVVKKRLEDAGLEAFCLEVHSNKASKAEITASLERRMNYRPGGDRSEQGRANAEALTNAKTELLYYVQHINDSAGRTGLKVYDVLLGSAIRDEVRAELPSSIVDARFANPLSIDPYSYRQMVDAAATLEGQMHALSSYGKLSLHPWRGFQNVEITELDEGRLVAAFEAWNESIIATLAAIGELEEFCGLPLAANRRDIKSLSTALLAIPLRPSEFLTVDTFRRYSEVVARTQVREALNEFSSLTESENALSAFCEETQEILNLSSSVLTAALESIKDLVDGTFSVSSIFDLQKQTEHDADSVASLSTLCKSLIGIIGLEGTSVGAVRAGTIAVGLVATLPRSLWHQRVPSVLEESNRAMLERGESLASELKDRRSQLNTEYDLQLLPASEELRTLGMSLRSANILSAFFSSSCRQARRTFRGIARDPSRKRRRGEIAEGLLRCGQYLADLKAMESDDLLRGIAGATFSGVETPFSELIAVSAWATEARRRLAPFDDIGLAVQRFLFTATPAQFDRLLALKDQTAFKALTGFLAALPSDNSPEWDEIVAQERQRAEKVRPVADLFAKVRFKPSCINSEITAAAELLEKIEAIKNRLTHNAPHLDPLGCSLARLRHECDTIRITLQYAETIAALKLPSGFLQKFFDSPESISLVHAVASKLQTACSTLPACEAEAGRIAQLDTELWCEAESFEVAPLQPLLNKNQRALANIHALRDYVSFLLAEDAACDQGIGPVLSAYSSADEDYRNLRKAVEFVFYRSTAEAILSNDPRLRRHSGATHQELRRQFGALDREHLEIKRRELAVKLTSQPVPRGNGLGPVSQLTELALVSRIAGQTRPRIVVRDLLNRAGTAIQALKPCWMMSPMSVAQYLDPSHLRFDLIIMDEASQIRPEEAVGAIARGAKAVIVGDQMQLPPTPFFQKLSAGEANTDDELFEDVQQDSVLEAASGRFHPSRRLKWHYRSEHDSLIAFSNTEFYEDDLTVFPSPFYDHPEYGVSLVQTDGVCKSGLNRIEGDAIANAAIEFMNRYPEQSLGLVAVNSKQTEYIREQLDRKVANDPGATAYAQRWNGKLEEYFVKNLENVQGDERDVIFISTVYGKDERGAFAQRFGPINGIYGHRRLNVLFTRAKKRVTVFTSMIPEDIQEEGKHRGVGVLKRYLQYARDGFITGPMSANGECDSEFERWVIQALQANGYEAVPQVGVCGYRIDIGVRHPEKPGIYLCGIECDGATYHSARSVRERDRLRQEVLERYNWKIYRIWSTDWFRNPKLQTSQMLAHLDQLHAAL